MGRPNFSRPKPGGLYRSRKGILFGVCRGIADYFNFSVFWTRALAILAFFITGVWPIVIIYVIAGLLLKPEPVIPISDEDQQEFYDSYTHSRYRAMQRLKRKFENLDRRIRRMEDTVTSRSFDWEERI